MSGRTVLKELIIEPGTGKALELRRGQILRIEQVAGRQCADFNCFNLHDYKEFFHTGRTRHLHGIHPTKGDFLWSAPPRERPMMAIIEDTAGTNDVIYPRCSAFLFEYHYGLAVHTNCHDIQAEAQREYGLTPDDVHDSFNFFMHTGIDQHGHPFIAKNTANKGDHVELLALIDVLAVPNVCGADVMMTSDFELKPLKLTVFEAADRDWESVVEPPKWRNQRSVSDFKVQNIKADRELSRGQELQALIHQCAAGTFGDRGCAVGRGGLSAREACRHGQVRRDERGGPSLRPIFVVDRQVHERAEARSAALAPSRAPSVRRDRGDEVIGDCTGGGEPGSFVGLP